MMYKNIRCLIITSIVLLIGCYYELNAQGTRTKNTPVIKEEMGNLIKAYPEFLKGADNGFIIWQDGSKMIFTDGKDKNCSQLIDSCDLENQMSMKYPTEANFPIPQKNFEPGRIRYQPFFLKMYGANKEEVESHLVEILWMPKTVNLKIRVTSINDVSKKLELVSKELDELPDSLKKFLTDTPETYLWRPIEGTNRLSLHSFGIAIDIDPQTSYTGYWKWDNKIKTENCETQEFEYKNKMPLQIVQIFEKHGFIWGGKWYHYDTMHFEYRPELLVH